MSVDERERAQRPAPSTHLAAPPFTRPRRRPTRQQRLRRTLVIAAALVVVIGLVVALVVVPPLLGRASAVARYEASAAEVTSLRTSLDTAFASSGTADAPPSELLVAIESALASGSTLITDDATAALQLAVSEADAALGGDDTSVLARPLLDVDTATVDELEAESLALESGLEALRAGESASPEALAAAGEQLASAWNAFRASLTAEGNRLLGAWSDAEKASEDAFFAELGALENATAAELGDALAAATTASETMIASAQAYRDEITAAATGVTNQPMGGDVDAQLSYLLAYWENYNLAEWGDYNPYGGDCVNFTSQGLIERGWQMDDRWSSPGASGFASKAWISTTAIEAYLTDQGFVSNDVDHLDRVRVGDVGIFDWGERGPGVDHTMTVSKVEYTPDGPKVYFVSHNADGDYRELMYTLYEQHSDSKVRIYSIP